MSQYSLKRLLASTAFIAVGVAYFGHAVLLGDEPSRMGNAGAVALWVVSGASIGAGILNLFGRPWIGAFCGGLAALAFLFYVVATIEI